MDAETDDAKVEEEEEDNEKMRIEGVQRAIHSE